MGHREVGGWCKRHALLVSAVPAVAVIALAQLPWYPGPVACQWTIHAAILLLPGWISCRDDPRWGRLFLIATVLALMPWIRAAYQPRALPVEAATHQRITVVCANPGVTTSDRQAVHRALAETAADIVGLAGIVPTDQRVWSEDSHYPNQIWLKDAEQPAELALLCHQRIITTHVHDLGGMRAIEALIDLGDGPVRVFLVHLSPPGNAQLWHERNRQLGELAHLVAAVREPLLVMGDINMAPGDPLWPVLLTAGHLLPGVGAEPASWPAWLGPCGIAIDHVLGRGVGLDQLHAVHLPGANHRGVSAVATVPMQP